MPIAIGANPANSNQDDPITTHGSFRPSAGYEPVRIIRHIILLQVFFYVTLAVTMLLTWHLKDPPLGRNLMGVLFCPSCNLKHPFASLNTFLYYVGYSVTAAIM